MDGALAAFDESMPRYDLECMPCVTHDHLSQLYSDGVLSGAEYARISDHSLGLTVTNGTRQQRPLAGRGREKDEGEVVVKRRKATKHEEAPARSP